MYFRNLKVTPPPPAVKVQDLGPLKAELKSSHEKLTESITKLGSFSRLFAKTMHQRVSSAETDIKHLLTQVRPQQPSSTFRDEFLDGLLAAAGPPSNKPSPVVSPVTDLEGRLADLEL